VSELNAALLAEIWRNTRAEKRLDDPDLARFQKFMILHEDMHATWDALAADPSTSLLVEGENLMLHVAMDAATETALETDQPPGLRQAFQMLTARGFDPGRAFHVLSQAMMHEFIVQAEQGKELDPKQFLTRVFDYAKQAMEQGPG
jgi:hypothetical protein